MKRVIQFKKKKNVDELLKQALSVPRTGGLEPDPGIRNSVVAQMSARERDGFNILRALSNVFPVRCPVYQVAFAMGIVLFAVLGIRKSQPDPATARSPELPAVVVDTSRTDTPRVSFSDTLSQHTIIDVFSPVDSL